MKDGALMLTLTLFTVLAFLFTLILYAWPGRNPSNRIGYGIFVSVLPAAGAFVLLKLTKLFTSWQRVAIVYLVLFVLVLIIQIFGRMVPVNT
jgi:hypothetical protein